MKALETVAAIFCAVVVLFLIPLIMRAGYTGDSMECIAESAVESICTELSATGELSLLDVQVLTERLMDCGYEGQFDVTVYFYEDAISGDMHQYAVTWEEIIEILASGNNYVFPKDCYVRIKVPGNRYKNHITEIAFGRSGFERTFVLGSGI